LLTWDVLLPRSSVFWYYCCCVHLLDNFHALASKGFINRGTSGRSMDNPLGAGGPACRVALSCLFVLL